MPDLPSTDCSVEHSLQALPCRPTPPLTDLTPVHPLLSLRFPRANIRPPTPPRSASRPNRAVPLEPQVRQDFLHSRRRGDGSHAIGGDGADDYLW